jgi:formylglycine-generating enzyme required for sulfatase activity
VSTEHSATDFYVTGGTMSPGAGSYVERPADEALFVAVERGEYCYVLTTRQMGKSSLMARTAQRLAAKGVRSAQITLETIRESSAAPDPDQFLYGIASRIHKALGLRTSLANWWRERDLLSATQRFHEYLTELLLETCTDPIVVFIDEIDSTIGLPFADDFFATIRACFNGRSSNAELKRLTFVLLGVATPAQLISDPARTPFNVGKGIELTDFTLAEAEPLTHGFAGSDAHRRALLDRALYWTGGHPYLTQTLCRSLAASGTSGAVGPAAGPDVTVDAEVERLFLRPEAAREEANLKFVRSRLTQGTRDLRAVLRTYQQVLKGKRVEDKPASSIHASLKLAGVVRTDADGLLRPRNRIYERVFGLEWVKRELPRDRWRAVAAAAAVLLLVGGSVSYFSLQRADTQLAQQTFQSSLLERLTTSDYAGLVSLARDPANPWDQATLTDEFLAKVDPRIFAEVPWLMAEVDPNDLFDTIERGHRLFVPSRPLFGAMSYALEEVWLRSSDVAVRERARTLAATVRDAFIAYHKERTPGFQAPPLLAAEDTLNAWVALPPGEFLMGADDITSDERPPHAVRLSAYSMQQHEVTNEEYGRFDPGHEFLEGQGRHPVANVSWYEAAGYAAWLGASLPTEAQWEYAAAGTRAQTRSGRSRRYPWGDTAPTTDRAVFSTQVGERRAPLAVSPPRVTGRTPEGIDDMAGNVWEWCRDWFGPYVAAPATDPLGPTSRGAEALRGSPSDAGRGQAGPDPTRGEALRVLRGGSFDNTEIGLRAAFRVRYNPVYRFVNIGFRLVSSRLRP